MKTNQELEFAIENNVTLEEALAFFYQSEIYQLISEGVSDLHCMSDKYLAEELQKEYADVSKIRKCIDFDKK